MVVVAVIGCGMMGRGIAACCANGGSEVRLWDNNTAQITGGVDAARQLDGFLRDAGVGQAKGSITAAATLAEAVRGCDFVFEAVIEDVRIKNKVFTQVEQHAPSHCIMCTNTSSLSVTEIATGLRSADRFVAAHFIGPAHLVPLVELCPAKQSAPASVPQVKRYLESIGKKPVVLNKEIQGFIAARMQAALYREGMHLVREGVASPEAVDGAVTDGFGRRLNQIGPFTVGDFAGVDLIQKTHATFFPQLGGYQRDLRSDELVSQGRNGVKNMKGNYDWTPEKAKEVAARRDAELLRRLKADHAAARQAKL
eukprot:TRINITY_DN68846_c0_g1_i1.p1 TRINITY_DN68846_c0_g1~~TRINITY_DN68846_c0_g1_i1.p1  ORF type:complete len:325 (+),score=122.28 TRINITY_DN68846_c0_g1_i1:48-977(+)